ncbi:MAG: zinc-ribbon domain-containing protein [Thermoplasmata archaeon]|nr:zinc-ribbon domain-containing protein [Thermoplasmata archaeon]
MLICQHCGRESSENASACPRCGKSLAPQFSTQYLQPPASYRAQQYASRDPVEPAYPATQFIPSIFSRAPHALLQPTEVPPSPYGTTAMICGIASVTSGILGMYLPIVGVIFALIAIPLGSVAVVRKETHGATGLALGILGLMLGFLWMLWLSSILYGFG